MTHRASMRASRGLLVLAALSMIAPAPGAATDPSQGLTEHVFLNSGVVRSNETFEMVAIGRRGGIADGSCMETYAYRQVMSNRNMATQDYTAGGAYQYLYRVEHNSSSGGASPPTGARPGGASQQFVACTHRVDSVITVVRRA